MMPLILFVVLSILSVYTACSRPPWFWAVLIGGPVCLDILADFSPFDIYGIMAGSLALRTTDLGFIGAVAGVLYQVRHQGLRFLRNAPGGGITGAISLFLVLKVIFSVLIFGDVIAANRIAAHAAGGLVAAIGDLRDQLLPLVVLAYAYAVRKSCNLVAIAWPIAVATCLLLLKAAVGIAITGRIWTGTAETELRFIASYDAVALTICGWLLLFLRAPRLNPTFARCLGCLALVTATIANHRSQWLAVVAGSCVLLSAALLGRPLTRNTKFARVLLAGTAFLLVAGLSVVVSSGNLTRRFPMLETLTVRLYAVTNPTQDADAEWRGEIWKDRISQVGANWPWGRPLGDRHATLVRGQWLAVPDHSAYVSTFELGGAILCLLVFLLSLIHI